MLTAAAGASVQHRSIGCSSSTYKAARARQRHDHGHVGGGDPRARAARRRTPCSAPEQRSVTPTFQAFSLRSISQTRFRTQQASFLTSQSQVRPRVDRCMRVDSCGG
jgi:hypothetical protein